ncbi:MAG: hypothetical protein KZQ87_19885 [Candidatus Thiodiazotropha sp. (ex Cardiolucina cf. quadrata)]|nr:hypothetical protein [Candidatus Thiodiazotropha sp. (ex Cardiolucina cf. quadrata)]
MREKISDNAPEWLVIEGLITSDKQFSLLHGDIMQRVTRNIPKGSATSPHYSLRLLDGNGDGLIEAPATIHNPAICHEFEPTHQRLSGKLPLLPEAANLAILHQGHEIYRRPIGTPLKLSVTWPKRRLLRGKQHSLRFKLSKPDNPDEALLILAIHWSKDLHRIIGISEPREKLSFDPGKLPGDRSCRLSVTYRCGFQSTTQFSPRLSMTPLPPLLRILKPREGTTFVTGVPISLVAEVDDPQGNREISSMLRWSIDGKDVGSKHQALLADIEEGEYTLRLAIDGYRKPVVERRIKIVASPEIF